ncbi:MAG: Preprotein translocase, SecG subunit [Parcubacteria group bacterium Athens0714_26]|nr:MAG: Preprotein translocase, SecG subunit [Parcubacteria group bacterium Athens0714_26]
MESILILAQIIVSILLVAAILLQQRGQALGGAFGGGGEFYATRRGVEKKIFRATIFLGILFVILAISNLIL